VLAALGLPPETIVTDPVGYGVRTTDGDLDAEPVHARDLARDVGDDVHVSASFIRPLLALGNG